MGAYPSEIASPLPGREFPNRGDMTQSFDEWLQLKRVNDQESFGFDRKYWVIHEKVYDLRLFMSKHPGGESWLQLMQGTDCTAAFETHHINIKKVKSILDKYYVCDLKDKSQKNKNKNTKNNENNNKNSVNNSHSFDWKENNKYYKLRELVYEYFDNKYKTTTTTKSGNSKSKSKSNNEWQKSPLMMQIFSLLALLLWLLTFINLLNNICILNCILSGIFLHPLIGVGHNYFHQSDSKQCACYFRYFFNITLFSWREWRVSHVISHHTYINLLSDYEISALEPIIYFMNESKNNPIFIYLYAYIFNFFVPAFSFVRFWLIIIIESLKTIVGLNGIRNTNTNKNKNIGNWNDNASNRNGLDNWLNGVHIENLIPLIEWACVFYMYDDNNDKNIGLFVRLWYSFCYWMLMHGVCGLILISVSTPIHRSDDCWSEGTPNGRKCFVEHTLMTTKDYAIEYHPFFSLFFFEMFNDHRLHHLFPTLDIYRIKEIRPLFEEFCRREDIGFKKYMTKKWTLAELTLGMWRHWHKINVAPNTK